MEWRLREFRPADQPMVRALVLAGLGEHWGEIDERLNPDLDDIAAAYAHGRTVVAVGTDGVVIGTGTVVPAGDAAQIVRMSVAPGARRGGLGGSIVGELVATATAWECERVTVETTSTWTDVVSFYERCGFRVTHVIEGPQFGSEAWMELVIGR